jgi:Calcineurin-like phosphoesterase
VVVTASTLFGSRRPVVLCVVVALLTAGAVAAPVRSSAVADPVVAIAGDIGVSGPEDEATAALIGRIAPDYVLTAGDNAYPDGTRADFAAHYDPSWGRFKARTRPSPGNHDYHDEAGSPPYYYTYFAGQLPAENGGQYYAFDVGSWRLYSLNCEIDCSAASPQVAWLRQDLATRGLGKHKLGYLHRPRYSCGRHGSSTLPDALWDALLAARADAVVAGHDHNYQRFPRMDSDARQAPTGMLSFVAGTGGAGLYPITGAEGEEGCALARAKDSATHGVLRLTLGLNSLGWAYVTSAGTIVDSGTTPTLDSGVSPPQVRDVSVGNGSDDAEQRMTTGAVSLTSWDLELGTNGDTPQIVGLRFGSLPVPARARIVSAYLQFQVDEVSTNAAALTVAGVADDSAAPFTAARGNLSSRPRTAARVSWLPRPWPVVGQQGNDQRTPNLAPLVQEIVNRPGWRRGNALAVLITGTGRRAARSFESGPPALLHVEYRF